MPIYHILPLNDSENLQENTLETLSNQMTHFKFPAHLFLLWSLCRVRTRPHKRWPAKSSFFQVVGWKAAPRQQFQQALQAWRHSLEQVLNSEATKEQVPPSPTQLEQCLSVNGGHRHHLEIKSTQQRPQPHPLSQRRQRLTPCNLSKPPPVTKTLESDALFGSDFFFRENKRKSDSLPSSEF